MLPLRDVPSGTLAAILMTGEPEYVPSTRGVAVSSKGTCCTETLAVTPSGTRSGGRRICEALSATTMVVSTPCSTVATSGGGGGMCGPYVTGIVTMPAWAKGRAPMRMAGLFRALPYGGVLGMLDGAMRRV